MPEDVDAALEWAKWDKAICSGCSHPLSEAMDPEYEGAYETEVLVCHACAEKDRRRHEADKLPDGARVVAYLPTDRAEVLRGGVDG